MTTNSQKIYKSFSSYDTKHIATLYTHQHFEGLENHFDGIGTDGVVCETESCIFPTIFIQMFAVFLFNFLPFWAHVLMSTAALSFDIEIKRATEKCAWWWKSLSTVYFFGSSSQQQCQWSVPFSLCILIIIIIYRSVRVCICVQNVKENPFVSNETK